MLGYALAFLAGGYVIPASMHFTLVWRTDRKAADNPSAIDSLLVALIAAVFWPAVKWRAVSNKEWPLE